MGEAHERTNITWGRTVKMILFRFKIQLRTFSAINSLICDDSAELFERGFEIFDDLLDENVGGRGDCQILRGFRL